MKINNHKLNTPTEILQEDLLNIFYCNINEQMDEDYIEFLISGLPLQDQIRLSGFVNRQAMLRSLFGRLITYRVFNIYYPEVPFHCCFSATGKPFIRSGIHLGFNIAHSGNLVICSFIQGAETGIDAEKILPVKFEEYINCFTPEEWDYIISSTNPEPAFYRLWTRKEAIIKANGRGMEIDLQSIDCLNPVVKLYSKIWYVSDFDFIPGYICSVASDTNTALPIRYYSFNPKEKTFNRESFSQILIR